MARRDCLAVVSAYLSSIYASASFWFCRSSSQPCDEISFPSFTPYFIMRENHSSTCILFHSIPFQISRRRIKSRWFEHIGLMRRIISHDHNDYFPKEDACQFSIIIIFWILDDDNKELTRRSFTAKSCYSSPKPFLASMVPTWVDWSYDGITWSNLTTFQILSLLLISHRILFLLTSGWVAHFPGVIVTRPTVMPTHGSVGPDGWTDDAEERVTWCWISWWCFGIRIIESMGACPKALVFAPPWMAGGFAVRDRT